MLEGHPFSAYGENVSLLIQSIVILLMLWQFEDDPKSAVSLREKSAVIAFAASYLVFATTILPSHLHHLLMASIYPIMLYARGSQIVATYRIGHTGNLSVITTSMSFAGSLVRIMTTIKEVGWDFAVLIGFFLSVGLNWILFVQYWYYRKNTIKYFRELEGRKQKDEKTKTQ